MQDAGEHESAETGAETATGWCRGMRSLTGGENRSRGRSQNAGGVADAVQKYTEDPPGPLFGSAGEQLRADSRRAADGWRPGCRPGRSPAACRGGRVLAGAGGLLGGCGGGGLQQDIDPPGRPVSGMPPSWSSLAASPAGRGVRPDGRRRGRPGQLRMREEDARVGVGTATALSCQSPPCPVERPGTAGSRSTSPSSPSSTAACSAAVLGRRRTARRARCRAPAPAVAS